ncbi:Acyl_transf_3 domain-containing protein [Caenorhabditis elegans]|uniref:Acyl_transf_3 domain-containing protein n=1 Tax=Caenorhabditis elegans TaxID=6239 RepID=O18139_CAEEL|nr:Acyl_transf_3 domain-containing protein [Caenorhabditis elegans]CAB04848.3 Acyl_transf_3 domain-containing protein [Caenorhabditis elegans]|eukprot:NP_507736.3 O-ACyltransferase homolog [Caenorhabditis elegans]
MREKPPKNVDLQGIRGISIISVLVFHFFPTQFPNGYLGVDQFFVLSGYLMCMLLQRSDQESPCSLVTLFYSKRLKRILPLYLFVIFLELSSLYMVFPTTSVKTNQKSASQALIFMSNRPKTAEEDYFQMLSIGIDIFTHTWSLSVEVQFYLLIPFLYLIGRNFNKNLQFLYYLTLGCTSYIFHANSSSTVSFNSVFARIWQFLIGFLAFSFVSENDGCCQYKLVTESDEDLEESQLLEEKEEEIEEIDRKIGEKSLYFCQVLLIFATLLPIFCSIPLSSKVVRPLITIFTGFLIGISKNYSNLILSNRFLVYFGDISYSLYLVHWPIFALWKLTENDDEIALFLSLFASICIATIIHETYEKWYLQLCSASIGILTISFFIANVGLIEKNAIIDQFFGGNSKIRGNLDNVTADMTMTDAQRLNHQWSVNDYDNLYTNTCIYEGVGTPLGWCRHTGLHGKLKIMTIGNSWTANHAKMFYQECGFLAKSILQGSAYGCEPLYPSHGIDLCKGNFTDFEEHVRNEKPDYAFMFTRFMTIGDPFPENVTSFDEDPIYQIMKSQVLKFISNIKYKIYILDAIPRLNIEFIERIVPMMWRGAPAQFIDNHLVEPKLYQMARRRYAQLEKDCLGKCILVDYVPEFWNKTTQTFRFFDAKGFSYFTTPTHLSPHGIEHIRHVWTDICTNLSKNLLY